MASSPQRNLSSFNEQDFTAQKKAQLRILYPNKSVAQIQKMVEQSLKEKVNKILQTSKPSTNQRQQNITNRKQRSGSKKDSSELNDAARKKLFSTEKKIPAIVPQENNEKSQPQPESNKKEEQSPGDYSSTGSPGQKKNKKIKKDSKDARKKNLDEYYNFCKYYRQKLKLQHPAWTSYQVSIILKLMWRKKVISSKKLSTHLMRRIPRRNPLTGRKYFGDMKRKEQNMESSEIRQNWYRLPQETRKYLARLGNGGDGFSYPLRTMQKTIRFKLRRELQQLYFRESSFSYLNSFISRD